MRTIAPVRALRSLPTPIILHINICRAARGTRGLPGPAYNVRACGLVPQNPHPRSPAAVQNSPPLWELQRRQVGSMWAQPPMVPNGIDIRARRNAGQVTEHALSTQARDNQHSR